MLIALLLLLGVDLIVVVAFAVLVIGRKRWVKRQPGAFAGAIRVTGGEIGGLGPKWKRGYGRWVRDVLVWNKAPLLLTSQLMAIDRIREDREANEGEVKRLGDNPVVIGFAAGGADIEVAASAEQRSPAMGELTPATNVVPGKSPPTRPERALPARNGPSTIGRRSER